VNRIEENNRRWLNTALRNGVLAARKNFWAGVILWLFGSAIVGSYYLVPAAREQFDRLAEVKTSWGYVFSFFSTAIFGGVIPSLIAATNNGKTLRRNLFLGVTNTLLWALKGFEIDWFYRVQATLFGNNQAFSTIVTKTFFDQLVYVPVFGLVNVVLFVLWRDNNFSCRRFRAALGPHWYAQHVLPVLISNWCVWIPAVLLIYGLPIGLQLPIQNLVLIFWILILTFFTSSRQDSPVETAS
jgi:hypothetical protein